MSSNFGRFISGLASAANKVQNFTCLILWKANLLGDPDKRVDEGDVQSIHEVGAKQSVMDGIATWPRSM